MKEYKRLTKRLMWSNAPFTEYASDNKVLQRLAELEDKIDNGTLIELPCKVGDTVYHTEFFWFKDNSKFYEVIEYTITGILIKKSCFVFDVENDDNIYGKEFALYKKSDGTFEFDDWFFTKAEAEAKLKELQK